jgi:4-diphosphocytidyl-2-C-methyl-D-erythritol kinase
MPSTIERARAKINLTLRIVGRRADRYHLLESLIAFAGVGDEVVFAPGAVAAVTTSGPFADAIAGDNLADTALARLAAADASLDLGSVAIDKRLPIASGIGGGSADAAAVLRAARSANPSVDLDWSALAASLGADVPVCLADRTALVWGVGEHIEPAGLPKLDAVLACPAKAAPFGKTRAVFAQLGAPAAETSPAPAALPRFADAAAVVAYMRSVGNDLRAPAHALMPASAEAEAALAAEPGCLHATLSGAGPTSYGIFADAAAAAAAQDRLRARHPDWWIVATTIGD